MRAAVITPYVAVQVTLPATLAELHDLDELLAAVDTRLGPLQLTLEADAAGHVVLAFSQPAEDLWLVVLLVMSVLTDSGYRPVHVAAGHVHP